MGDGAFNKAIQGIERAFSGSDNIMSSIAPFLLIGLLFFFLPTLISLFQLLIYVLSVVIRSISEIFLAILGLALSPLHALKNIISSPRLVLFSICLGGSIYYVHLFPDRRIPVELIAGSLLLTILKFHPAGAPVRKKNKE